MGHIVVEPDLETRRSLARMLRAHGIRARLAPDAAAAMAIVDADVIWIACAMQLPDGCALDLLARVHELSPRATRVVVVDTAAEGVDAVRTGMADWVLRRPVDATEVAVALDWARHRRATEDQ